LPKKQDYLCTYQTPTSMFKAVITGKLLCPATAAEWKQFIADNLKACAADIAKQTNVKVGIQIDGDSLTALVDKPEHALTVAVALKAKLASSTPEDSEMWDARLSIGVGEVSSDTGTPSTDGEAFRRSSEALGNIGKRRLCFSTPWPEVDYYMNILAEQIDYTTKRWTAKQALIVYYALLFHKPLNKLADQCGMDRKRASYIILESGYNLITFQIKQFTDLIADLCKM
jgi:hypothetical protein